jgi:hypothetical protein
MQVAVSDDTVRGVTRRNALIWEIFRKLARGDFRHDFDEGVDTRDKIIARDAERFFEIAKNISQKGRVWLLTQFQRFVGTTIFPLLSPGIDRILGRAPEGAGAASNDFLDEEALLALVGVDYAAIKEEIKRVPFGTAITRNFRVYGPTVPDTRSYEIRGTMYRRGLRGEANYKENQNLTTMFRTVTGGKNKFVLILDATGGLPMSELLNATLEPYAPGGEFYIIENIENAADSATKLSTVKATTKDGRTPPTLRFLRDTANTVVYPLWHLHPSDPKSNVYSSLQIVLNRVSDTQVEANISVVDAQGNIIRTINIGDVSNSSNVKNATLYALAKFLEEGLVEESLVYTLIKRMGDWCQALSMLDLDRVYDILNETRTGLGGKTTLRELLVDSEVGVVTNDRILLALCILLGLNVFFTTAMDLAMLLYFKNQRDLPAGPELKARADGIRAGADIPPSVTAYGASLQGILAPFTASILAEQSLPMYIARLKCFVSNVGRLRNEFNDAITKHTQYKTLYDSLNDETDPTARGRFEAASAMMNIAAKLVADVQYNTQVLAQLAAGQYPGSNADQIRLDALSRKLASGGRITKSVEVTEAKEILLGIRDDLKQVNGKGLFPVGMLQPLLRTNFAPSMPPGPAFDRVQTNYNEILSGLPALLAVLGFPAAGGGRQRGGRSVLDDVYLAIRTRSIRLLPMGSTQEVTSTKNIYRLGDTFFDEKLRQYTVADEYIVTEDDLPTFRVAQQVRSPEGTDTPNAGVYIDLKYRLLQHDHIINALEKIDAESEGLELIPGRGTREDSGVFDPGSITMSKLLDIKQQTDALSASLLANPSPIVGGVPELKARLVELRTRLIEEIQRIAPLNPIESAQTQALEAHIATNLIEVPRIAGYYRESIVQRIMGGLGIRPGTDDIRELGNHIDRSFLEGPIRYQEDSAPTVIADSIADAVQAWAMKYRPSLDTRAILNYVRTYASYIQQQELAKQPAVPPRTNGGFQGRRALYKNAGSRTSSSARRGLYAGLRERTWPSTTARVRQRSSHPRTWRQRKHLDRL